jgi:hypothetical protein
MQESGANARNAASVAAQREGNAARGSGGQGEGGVIIKTPSGMQRFIGMTQYNQLAPEVQKQMEIIGTFDNKRNPRMNYEGAEEDATTGRPTRQSQADTTAAAVAKKMEANKAAAAPPLETPEQKAIRLRNATRPTGAIAGPLLMGN